ncbi:MAG TPA: hypothetical protein VL360_04920 [Gammaproteobacteria bacterium]|nr:hypothetical protein [Gammaproteobacteria bacterium]
MGILQWIKDTKNAVVETVQNVYYAARTVVSVTGSILFSQSFRVGLSDWLTQGMQGFIQAFSPTLYTRMIKTNDTAKIWWTGHASTLLRLAPVLLYRTVGRPVADAAIESVIGNTLLKDAAVIAVDVAATTYLLRSAANGLATSVVNDLNMQQASANESLPRNERGDVDMRKTGNVLIDGCIHDDQANTKAGVTSTLHYYSTLIGLRIFAQAMKNTIPYGEFVTVPLEMLLMGRSVLEYPMAAAGTCYEDRLKELNKNNPTAFGIGASYWLSEQGLNKAMELTERLIAYYTGLEPSGYTSLFYKEVISSILTLHFIMSANLQRNNKLPGTKEGIDWFRPARLATDAVAADTPARVANYVSAFFPQPKVDDWYQDMKKQFQDALDMPPIYLVTFLLLTPSLKDWDKWKQRPEIEKFFELYGMKILEGLEFIKKERARPEYKGINAASQWAAEKNKDESYLSFAGKWTTKKLLGVVASKDDRQLLAMLMQRELKKPLNDWEVFIRDILRTVQFKKNSTDDDVKSRKIVSTSPIIMDDYNGKGDNVPVTLRVEDNQIADAHRDAAIVVMEPIAAPPPAIVSTTAGNNSGLFESGINAPKVRPKTAKEMHKQAMEDLAHAMSSVRNGK